MEKISMNEFVRQISKKSGYAQTDIKAVLNFASECVAENLNDGVSTTMMHGVIIYPAVYPARDIKDKNGDIIQPPGSCPSATVLVVGGLHFEANKK